MTIIFRLILLLLLFRKNLYCNYFLTHGQLSFESTNSHFTWNCKYGNGNNVLNIYYYYDNLGDYDLNHKNDLLPKDLGEK